MKMKRFFMILLAMLTMVFILSNVVFASDAESTVTKAKAEEVKLIDGSFSSETDVPVNVELTIEDGKITNVVITDVKVAGKDEEPNPNVDQEALDALAEQVLAAQGPDIEGVEGAEALTNAVKSAVNSALEKSAEAAKPAKLFGVEMSHDTANLIVGLLGLLCIVAIVVTLFKSKTQPAIAFIVFPILLAIILVIGGRYSLDNLTSMIKKGFETTSPTAALFVFSVLYFGIMSDAGMFDKIINALLKVKFIRNSVVGVCILTVLIALLAHLDGGGASTFCIVVPAMLPIYKRMHMRKTTLLRIAVLGMGILNLMPWAGPTMRAATVIGEDPNSLWLDNLIWIQVFGIVLAVLHAILAGIQEKKRGAGLSGKLAKEEGEVALEEGEQVAANTSDLARPKLFWFNLILTIGVIALLIWGDRVFDLPNYIPFMIGTALALFVNYGLTAKMHKKIINLHAGPALMMCSTLMGAAVLMGILTSNLDAAGAVMKVKETMSVEPAIPSVVNCLGGIVAKILPDFLGQNLPLVIGILSVPLALAFDTDSYFYGILPVMIAIGAAFGVEALPIAIAMVVCRNCATFISPMVPATLLGIGLAEVEIKDHIKSSFLYVWVFSILCMLFAVVIGVMPL